VTPYLGTKITPVIRWTVKRPFMKGPEKVAPASFQLRKTATVGVMNATSSITMGSLLERNGAASSFGGAIMKLQRGDSLALTVKLQWIRVGMKAAVSKRRKMKNIAASTIEMCIVMRRS